MTDGLDDGARAAPAVDLRSDVLSPPTAGDVRGHDPRPHRLAAARRGPHGRPPRAAWPPPCWASRPRCSCPTRPRPTCSRCTSRAPAARRCSWMSWPTSTSSSGTRSRSPGCCRGRSRRTAATSGRPTSPPSFADDAGGRSPRIDLLVLENTHTFAGGVAIGPDETTALAAVAHDHGCPGPPRRRAPVRCGRGPRRPGGCPGRWRRHRLAEPEQGTVCARTAGCWWATLPTVAAARDLANRIGFGRIHKAGYLAAAGIVALETGIDRLADDHRRARRLGEAMATIDGLRRRPRHGADEPGARAGGAAPG